MAVFLLLLLTVSAFADNHTGNETAENITLNDTMELPQQGNALNETYENITENETVTYIIISENVTEENVTEGVLSAETVEVPEELVSSSPEKTLAEPLTIYRPDPTGLVAGAFGSSYVFFVVIIAIIIIVYIIHRIRLYKEFRW